MLAALFNGSRERFSLFAIRDSRMQVLCELRTANSEQLLS
jgi:hypothetical protein